MIDQSRICEIGYELCSLISATLNGCDATYNERNLDVLFDLSCRHKLLVLVYTALDEKAKSCNQWINAFHLSIIQKTYMDAERQALLEFFEENNIWYLLMKGLVLQELYPDPHLREMCDNDILYDGAKYAIVRKYMLNKGYSIEHASPNVHVDEYDKNPYCHFELHKNFFNANRDKLSEYYKDITSFLKSADGCEKKMSSEDFYVYMIAHCYKHFIDGGTGLRSFVDCYLYNQKVSYNKDYVITELEKLGICDFEKSFRVLANKLFCGEKIILNKDEREVFLYVISSGAYGTKENYIKNQLSTTDKKRYLLNRLFPPLEWYKGHVPFCYKHKWAIPFYSVYRVFNRVIKHSDRIKTEVDVVKNMKKKD